MPVVMIVFEIDCVTAKMKCTLLRKSQFLPMFNKTCVNDASVNSLMFFSMQCFEKGNYV